MNVENLVSIASFPSTLEAELARDYLATEGVEAYLDGANNSAIWQLGGRLGTEVQLLVAEHDEDRAKAVLEQRDEEVIPESELEQIAEEATPIEQEELAEGEEIEGRPGVHTMRGLPLFVGICFLVSPIIVLLSLKFSAGSLIIGLTITGIVYLLLTAYYKYNTELEEPADQEELDLSEPDPSDFEDDR